MSKISKAEERRRAVQSATDKANAAKRKKQEALQVRVSARSSRLDLEKIAREHIEKMLIPTGQLFPSVFREVELEPKPPAIDTSRLAELKDAEPYRPVKRQPDYVHVLTGWRAWRVRYTNEGRRLQALGQDHVWEPKKQIAAECAKSGSVSIFFGPPPFQERTCQHAAPAFNCECGIWAFKDLDRLVKAVEDRNNKIEVLGSVSLWGRVIETENGYRAQYAYPSELWLFNRELEELGLIYDVPVRCV